MIFIIVQHCVRKIIQIVFWQQFKLNEFDNDDGETITVTVSIFTIHLVCCTLHIMVTIE